MISKICCKSRSFTLKDKKSRWQFHQVYISVHHVISLEEVFTLESEDQRLVYYHDSDTEGQRFDFRINLLIPNSKIESTQFLMFESRRREFEWNIEVNIGVANLTATINSISNLSGKKVVEDLYIPAGLRAFTSYQMELYLNENDELHFVLTDPGKSRSL